MIFNLFFWQPKNKINTYDLLSLDVVFDLTSERLSAQMAHIDALDTKAGFVLASASLLTGVLIVWKEPSIGTQLPAPLEVLLRWVPFIALVIFIGVILTSYMAFKLRKYDYPPHPERLESLYLKKPEQETKGTVLRNMVEGYQQNEETIKVKLFWIRASFVALGLETVIVALILLLQAIL